MEFYYKGNMYSTGGGGSDYFDLSYPESTNLFDGDWKDGYLLDQVVANWHSTDYIPVTGGNYLYVQFPKTFNIQGDNISVTSWNTLSVRTYFFDASKTQISYVTNSDVIKPIPSNASYVRITYNTSNATGATMFVGESQTNTDAYMPYSPYYQDGIKSAYLNQSNFRYTDAPHSYGKTWVLFGDSLTDAYGGHDWQKGGYSKGEYGTVGDATDVPWTDYFFASKIAREFGYTIDNRAKSGSMICVPMASTYRDVCGVYMLDAFLAEVESETIEQPDIITIAFGSNAYDNQIGTESDTSAVTEYSYYGATRYFIENLRSRCPKSSFGFVLPPVTAIGNSAPSCQPENVTLARNALKYVCEDEGVPYIDMSKVSGITPAMLPDGVHISGHQANNLYYHTMRRFVMGL